MGSQKFDPNYKPKNMMEWFEYRLPIFSFLDNSLGSKYPAPRNLNYWWNFGSMAGLCLIIQILTGIFLAMQYTAHADMAFDSVERIMRDVNYGWLLRYTHAVGASMFFTVVYIHIFRGLYYGSYKAPREVLWWLGIIIFILMMATAFMGYVLPWGQMSFWGATVITNFFNAFPLVGEPIVAWLRGGFAVDNPALNRFFSLHYLLPFVIVGVVVFHIWALHRFGSNNPLGIEVKGPADTIPFHPYYTVKDAFTYGIFFIIFAWFIFFAPNSLGHPDNYIPANPMVTPPHIVPEWYFLPFYAILRAVPDIGFPFLSMGDLFSGKITPIFVTLMTAQLAGVLTMFAAIFILFFLPWIDRSKVRSCAFRPMARMLFWAFVVNCVVLGYVGGKPAEGAYLIIGRIATMLYFGYFIALWAITKYKLEKPLPLPDSISTAVLLKGAH